MDKPQLSGISAKEAPSVQLTNRVVAGLWVILAVAAAFVPFDYLRLRGAVPAVPVIQGSFLGLVALSLAVVRKLTEAGTRRLGVVLLILGCLDSAAIGVLTGNTQSTALLSIAAVLAAATTIPWGPQTQALAAGAASVILIAATVIVHGTTLLTSPEMAAFLIVMTASVWVAAGMERQRHASALSEALRRKTEHHKAVLLELSRTLSESVEQKALLDAITAHATPALGADMAAIFRWSEARQGYVVIASFGVPDALRAQVECLQFPRSQLCGGRLGGGETIRQSLEEVPAQLPGPLLRSLGARHLLATRLRCGSRDEGTLVVVRAEDVAFSAEDEPLIEAIASQAGAALERVALMQAAREDAHVADTLAGLSQRLLSAGNTQAVYEALCQHCAESLHAETAYVWLRNEAELLYHAVAQHGDADETWQVVRTVKLEELGDYAGRLTRERVVVATGDEILQLPRGEWALSLGITRLIHIALERGGKLFGSITCSYRQPPFEWTAMHQRIADGICRVASLAIENAHLIEALERASRVKSDFVSTMSHELRTPLNVIIGYNDLLLDDAFGPTTSEQRDTLRRVLQHSRALLTLINQTLDVGKLESGGLAVKVDAAEVPDIMREVDAETKELQAKPGIDVRWQVNGPLPALFTDAAKLKMALRNLVHNAIKFTDAGEVEITANARDGGVELSVRDSGIGIREDALESIFEAFQQGDDSPNSRFDGVGLGLYISRRLIEVLGGNLSVESREGQGSAFRIWVPQRAPALPRSGS